MARRRRSSSRRGGRRSKSSKLNFLILGALGAGAYYLYTKHASAAYVPAVPSSPLLTYGPPEAPGSQPALPGAQPLVSPVATSTSPAAIVSPTSAPELPGPPGTLI